MVEVGLSDQVKAADADLQAVFGNMFQDAEWRKEISKSSIAFSENDIGFMHIIESPIGVVSE